VIHAGDRHHFEFTEEGLDVQFLADAHLPMRARVRPCWR
jgi:hypothetical protein